MNQKERYSSKTLNLLALFLLFAGHASDAASPLLDEAKIQEIIKNRIDFGEKTSGIVVGIIDAKGKKIISHGYFDKTKKRAVDGRTLFEIGSVTKVFTSLLLADMVQNREVNLHDPIAKFFPMEMPGLKRGGKEITLLHLANHTSGLPRLPDNMDSDSLPVRFMRNPKPDSFTRQ